MEMSFPVFVYNHGDMQNMSETQHSVNLSYKLTLSLNNEVEEPRTITSPYSLYGSYVRML